MFTQIARNPPLAIRRRTLAYGVAFLVAIGINIAPLYSDVQASVREGPQIRDGGRWVMQFFDELRNPPLTPTEVGSGGPATSIQLFDPMGLASSPDGSIIVSDRGRGTRGRFVWQILSDGTAAVIAGTGRQGAPLDGQHAVDAAFGSIECVAVDAAGRVYLVDSENHAVYRIEPDGTLTRFAGTGRPGRGGDGGPAAEAELAYPFDVRLAADGSVYIADYGGGRIRRVDPDGIMHTVAGTGAFAYSGDGGPAIAAEFNGPYGIALDNEGRLLIADTFNEVVRRVGHDGVIETIAGTGTMGYTGDGGPWLAAELSGPQGLAVDDRGQIYIGDEHNNAIRVLRTDGTIETVVGGTRGPRLNDPENVLLLDDGSLIITDGDNRVVWRVAPDGSYEVIAGTGG